MATEARAPGARAVLRGKGGHHSEKPIHRREEWPPLAAAGESRAQRQGPSAAKNKKTKNKKNIVYEKVQVNGLLTSRLFQSTTKFIPIVNGFV